MSSIHRLRRRLLGYLIPFATYAFVPERQNRSSELPSPLVFWLILTDFTPTPAIPLASPDLKSSHLRGRLRVGPGDFTKDVLDRLRTLYAQ